MPQISEKGMAMPSSPIRKLVPFADKAKERGIKVYHLNIFILQNDGTARCTRNIYRNLLVRC